MDDLKNKNTENSKLKQNVSQNKKKKNLKIIGNFLFSGKYLFSEIDINYIMKKYIIGK